MIYVLSQEESSSYTNRGIEDLPSETTIHMSQTHQSPFIFFLIELLHVTTSKLFLSSKRFIATMEEMLSLLKWTKARVCKMIMLKRIYTDVTHQHS